VTSTSGPPEPVTPGSTPLDYDDLDDTAQLVTSAPHELSREQLRRVRHLRRERDRDAAFEAMVARLARRYGWRLLVLVALAAVGPIVERVVQWALR
jgi:hypothetical protein